MLSFLLLGLLLLLSINGSLAQCPARWEPDGQCTMGGCIQTSELCQRTTNVCCRISKTQAVMSQQRNPKTGQCENTWCPPGAYKDGGCSVKGFCLDPAELCINGDCCQKYYLPDGQTSPTQPCTTNQQQYPYQQYPYNNAYPNGQYTQNGQYPSYSSTAQLPQQTYYPTSQTYQQQPQAYYSSPYGTQQTSQYPTAVYPTASSGAVVYPSNTVPTYSTYPTYTSVAGTPITTNPYGTPTYAYNTVGGTVYSTPYGTVPVYSSAVQTVPATSSSLVSTYPYATQQQQLVATQPATSSLGNIAYSSPYSSYNPYGISGTTGIGTGIGTGTGISQASLQQACSIPEQSKCSDQSITGNLVSSCSSQVIATSCPQSCGLCGSNTGGMIG